MDAVHHFYAEHAKKYGLEEAVLLYDIIYWIAHNTANGVNFHDGRYWTFNKAAAFADMHPYWKDEKNGRTDKIQRIINSLVKQGAIIKGNYNATAYDRTSWYALSDELAESIAEMFGIEYAKMRNGFCENAEPIPNNKPNNKPNISTDTAPQVADAPQPVKKERFSFRDKLIAEGISAENADRLMANRKAKGATNSVASFNRLMGLLEQVCNARGVTHDEAIEFASKRGWCYINPAWNLEGLTAKVKRSMRTMTVNELIQMESAKR